MRKQSPQLISVSAFHRAGVWACLPPLWFLARSPCSPRTRKTIAAPVTTTSCKTSQEKKKKKKKKSRHVKHEKKRTSEIPKPVCTDCHTQQGADYELSVHGHAAKKGGASSDCSMCHGAAHELLNTKVAAFRISLSTPARRATAKSSSNTARAFVAKLSPPALCRRHSARTVTASIAS